MTADISNIILLVIYEFFIIFSSIRITYLITKKFQKKILLAEIILAWISIGIILNIIIPSIFSFLQYNGIVQYLVTSFLIVIILHINKKSQLSAYKNYLSNTFNSIFTKMWDWKIIVIISALLPVILISMKPVSTYDSLYFLNFMFTWIFNQSTPYSSAWNYVPLWELSYLPSMIISKSDNFFWLNSFKPLIILGVAGYLIGQEIKLPKYLIWISIFSSFLFFMIWINPAWDVGSLKNDFIFAAGVLLIIFSLIRSFRPKFDLLTALFFSIGLIFITMKFSGVILGLVSVLIFIFINKNRILKNKKKITVWAFFAISFFLLMSGHYYIRNTVEYDNPVWPAKIELFGYNLPGELDTSNTSIFSHLGDKRVQEVFFPTSKISKGGLFFPVLVIIGFVGTLSFITFSVIRYLKTRTVAPAILVISIFIFLTWSLYLITPFSAEHPDFITENKLRYIVQNELSSTKYIIGTLFVTELFFVFILWRLKVPIPIIFSIMVINIISRYWILASFFSRYPDTWLILYPMAFLIGIFLFVRYKKNIISNTVIMSAIIILILILSPNVVEDNRQYWLKHNTQWHDVSMYLHDLPSSKIILIKESGGGGGLIVRTYPVYGAEFQHIVKIFNVNQLIHELNKAKNNDAKPDYVVSLCRPIKDCESPFTELESKLSEYNFEPVLKIDQGIILKKFN